MQYVVESVGNDELPEGRHWLVVERDDAPALLLINGPPASCWAFMQATQSLAEPSDLPTLLIHPPRHLEAV